MITMLIDHIGAVVMEYGLYYQGGCRKLFTGSWKMAMASGYIGFSV